ncbi:copper chaperone PCu(A)C [Halopseudomonas sabulinigri]
MSFHKVLSVLCFCCLSPLLAAHEFEAGTLHIDHPWSRALPAVAKTGAAYLSITNHGERGDTLLGADTPIAGKVEMHEHLHQDGLMKMQQVVDLPITAGERLTFQPGGYHLMLFNLAQPLNAGEHFPLTLHFAEAGDVEVVVNIQADAEPQAPKDSHSTHGDHLSESCGSRSSR